MKRSAYFVNIGRGMTTRLDDLNAAQLEALGARAQPGLTFAQLQSDNPGRVQRLNALTDRANALAASIDLVECISGTPRR